MGSKRQEEVKKEGKDEPKEAEEEDEQQDVRKEMMSQMQALLKQLHLLVGEVRGSDMRERWLDGIYVGKEWEPDEDLILMADGRVVRSHATVARPDRH